MSHQLLQSSQLTETRTDRPGNMLLEGQFAVKQNSEIADYTGGLDNCTVLACTQPNLSRCLSNALGLQINLADRNPPQEGRGYRMCNTTNNESINQSSIKHDNF